MKIITLALFSVFSLTLVEVPYHLIKPRVRPEVMEGWHCGLKLCECASHKGYAHGNRHTAGHHGQASARQEVPEKGFTRVTVSQDSSRSPREGLQTDSKDSCLIKTNGFVMTAGKGFLSRDIPSFDLPLLVHRLDKPPEGIPFF